MNTSFRAVAALCVTPLVACSWSEPPLPESTFAGTTIAPAADWSGSLLRAGDLVAVDVFGHVEFDTPDGGVRVDTEGRLPVPYLDPIEVRGMELSDLRARLTAELSRFVKDPRVSVVLLERAPRWIYIVGQVESPGRYQIDSPITALHGLAYGGGFLSGADRDDVVLIRTHGDELEAHAFSTEPPDRQALVALQPDDILFIRRSGAAASVGEIIPYLQATAFATGSVANMVFTLQAFQ